jgi:hypothetical protein
MVDADIDLDPARPIPGVQKCSEGGRELNMHNMAQSGTREQAGAQPCRD